jgi:hypothetical protein
MANGFTNNDFNADGTITGNAIENTPIGAGTPSTGAFTSADIDGGTIDGATIGVSAAAAGNFTSIGATTPGTGAFTSADIDGGSIDGATLGTNSAITEAQIDNLNIDGNIISATNTNGDVELIPNGTGNIILNCQTTGSSYIALEDAGTLAARIIPEIMNITDSFSNISLNTNRGAYLLVISGSNNDEPVAVFLATSSSNAGAGIITTLVSTAGGGAWAAKVLSLQWGGSATIQVKHDRAGATLTNARVVLIGL